MFLKEEGKAKSGILECTEMIFLCFENFNFFFLIISTEVSCYLSS